MDLKNLDRGKIAAILAVILVVAAAVAFGLTMREKPNETSGAVALERKKQIENACASNTTFQGLKRLVFDQAASRRTLERANFDILAAGAIVRMEDPVVRGRDETLDITHCSGRFILELPPGAEAAFNGDRRLMAETLYEVQAAADGSGPVYRTSGAEGIISRLAAFDMQGRQLEAPPAAPDTPLADPGSLPPVAPEPSQAPSQPPSTSEEAVEAPTTSNPSFDCRYARTRGELLVCGSDRLAAQDRNMAELYGAAMDDADGRTRRRLVRTRDAFLAYRDRCRDSACVTRTYEGRIREIRDIMSEAY
jgi:uncharacterized protein YecT (DUF1311 family)